MTRSSPPSPEVLQRLLAARAAWRNRARPEQLTPQGEWNVWLLLAGRGFGKTRTGAEDIARYAVEHSGARLAVVAPTFADARDTCVEGESGLLAILHRYGAVRTWNRSLGELKLLNKSRIKLFSADEPERLRGPQHHRAWCDELGSWRYPDAWDQLMFGLRLGERPQALVTTTPRPTKLVRELLGRPDVLVTRGSTWDNAPNLAPAALESLRARYEGTRLGRQELEGLLLEDVPGALWTLTMIDRSRLREAPDLSRIVVGVDPAVTSGESADETGIVVVGSTGQGRDQRFYVLADLSGRFSPGVFAEKVALAFDAWNADRVVVEANQGGEHISHTIRSHRHDLPVTSVHAHRGKELRAEPVAALYEQGKISHVGTHAALEDQMTSWVPGVGSSPDRVDALVHAVTHLAGSARGPVMRFTPRSAA